MIKQNVPLPSPYRPAIFLIALGDDAKKTCFELLHKLRLEKIDSQMDFSGRKLNKVMQYADQIQAKYVAVVGDNKTQSNVIELKVMATREKLKMPLSDLVSFLLNDQGTINLINH